MTEFADGNVPFFEFCVQCPVTGFVAQVLCFLDEQSFWVGFKSRPDWVWRLITTFLGNSINRHALAKLPAAGGEERSTVRFAGPGSVVVVTCLPS